MVLVVQLMLEVLLGVVVADALVVLVVLVVAGFHINQQLFVTCHQQLVSF